MKNYFKINGIFEMILKDVRTGHLLKRRFKNLITNDGLNVLAQVIAFTGDPAVVALDPGTPYIALGQSDDGTTPAPVVTDEKLNNELPDLNVPRKACSGGMSQINNVAKFSVAFATDEGNPDGGYQLVEAGLFWNNASATRETGDLVSRVKIIPPEDKGVYKTMGINWYYEINRG